MGFEGEWNHFMADPNGGPAFGLTEKRGLTIVRPLASPRGTIQGPRRRPWCGAVAQLGERRVRNAKVRGSTPLGSTIKYFYGSMD